MTRRCRCGRLKIAGEFSGFSDSSHGRFCFTWVTRPCAWKAKLNGPTLSFEYRLIDMRSLEGERLLESGNLGENVIAVLARLRDLRGSP